MGKEMENVVNAPDYYKKLSELDSAGKGIIRTNAIGLICSDPEDAPRCGTCDSRNCGSSCHAAVGTVYIVTFGYRSEEHAKQMEALGAEVRWDDKGFVAV
jgi:hypothetical protein